MSDSLDPPFSELFAAIREGQDQHAAAADRKARRERLEQRMAETFADVIGCLPQLLSPNENSPDDAFWNQLAMKLQALAEFFGEANREYPLYRIHKRLERATKTGVPAVDTAAYLLLSAPQAAPADLAATLRAIQMDSQRDLWAAWLPYILDQLINSHRPPGMLPVIPGATRDELRKADLAFGCILFTDEAFRAMQENVDQSTAAVYSALEAGGHAVPRGPVARVRDLMAVLDPRALNWFGSEPPKLQLVQPPSSIQAIAQPEESRRVLDEIWTAASFLKAALDKWAAWFVELHEKGDANPAVALTCDDLARRAIKVLATHRPSLEPFDRADVQALTAILPPIPTWDVPSTLVDVGAISNQRIERPRIRWQEDQGFLDRYYLPPEMLQDKACRLRGAAAKLLEMLTTFPETLLGMRRLSQPTGGHARSGGNQDSHPSHEDEADVSTAGGGQANRMSVNQANETAMKRAKKMKRVFFMLSQREQAKLIGCAFGTWKKTQFFAEAQKRRPRAGAAKPSSPKTTSFTAKTESVTGEGGKDEVLNQLIADQEADGEPSTLEDDPPTGPRKFHCRKRL
jgi:hypothetical protein